jgi:hypothetical protein
VARKPAPPQRQIAKREVPQRPTPQKKQAGQWQTVQLTSARRDVVYIDETLRSPPVARRSREIFVAYPYSFPEDDYRGVFADLEKAFNVKFRYADEQITNRQILAKIENMILSAQFSLFDVTTWNANVALELGIAMGRDRDYYLLFDPTHARNPKGGELPADLGGIDRIQYRSYGQLREGITKLLAQEFGVRAQKERQEDPVLALRTLVMPVLEETPGLKIGEIADALNISTDLAKVVIRPMVAAGSLRTKGATRAMRYYVKPVKGKARKKVATA